jgi:hypothetical protein
LARTTADLVEEAIALIERGEMTPEEGAARYGEDWPALRPAVELALQIEQAANPPIVSRRAFTPLDKAAGWQALKAQLEVPAPVARPVLSRNGATARPPAVPVAARTSSRAATAHPVWYWLEAIADFFGTKVGRAAFGTMLGLALVVALFLEVNASLPGDPFYRAKLGWDHLGELTSFDPNDRAQAALNYADHRLNELEKLAYVGKPDQILEAQGQYLLGLDASLQYSNQKNFSSYSSLYNRLNSQKDRVSQLQQNEYIFGPRSQLNILSDHLNSGVYSLAPKVPGAVPPPTTPAATSSAPGTPSPGTAAAPSTTPKTTVAPTAGSFLQNIGESTGISKLLGPTPTSK